MVAHANGDQKGDDVLFIHSNGKDAAQIPLELLRSAGTPVRAIVDFDVLNSQLVLSQIVEALTNEPMPDEMGKIRNEIGSLLDELPDVEKLQVLVDAVADWMKNEYSDFRPARKRLAKLAQNKSKWEQVKRKGIEAFDPNDQPRVDELLTQAKDRGLHIVRCGELESWMDLRIAKGPRWNRAALEQIRNGDCPGDLQEFVTEIVAKIATSPESGG